MPHRIPGLLLAGFVSSLALAAPAAAVTVTAQIEGRSVTAGPAAVATTGPVTREGQSCPDGSTVSVLDAQTAGDWQGTSKAAGGSFDGPTSPGVVLGESHQFGSGSFWAVYVNGLYQNDAPCNTIAAAGDEVLWYWADDPFVEGSGGYDEPLHLSGVPGVVRPGEPFTVTVRQSDTTFANFVGTTTLNPATGATVNGATAGADGRATLSLASRGPQVLMAVKGNRAPDRATVCVTDGQDGFCGSELARQAGGTDCVTTGDDGRCGSPDRRPSYGFITSLREQQRFARRRAPRELAGRVDADPSGLRSVELRLTRTYGKRRRCSTFDATRQRRVGMARCGAAHGRWFSAAARGDWSYLLPEALPRGRYVLDVRATDGAGNADTTLHRGRNRIVFHVR